MKREKMPIVLIIIFIVGAIILTYPFISQYWNSKVQSRAIVDYDEMLKNIKVEDYTNMFSDSDKYNQELSKLSFPLVEYKKLKGYNDLLNINKNGMIGYITIDKIGVQLPIYHGINSAVLNTSVGHMEGSSLPVGGESTHSVLSAHSGLPSAKLFTNLHKLEAGDNFVITVLDRQFTYQVEEIMIVKPNDVSNLEIVPLKDYVTLITCTPYGINTHRLLVRGTRIENVLEKVIIISRDAYKIDKTLVSLFIAIPILILLIIYAVVKPVKKRLDVEDLC